MAIHNSGIQVQEYVYDFAVDGGAVSAIRLDLKANEKALPAGAVMVSATLVVQTAFTSGGAATLSVGNQASATAYIPATAVGSLTANAVVKPTLTAFAIVLGTNDQVIATIAAAAMTAGKAKLFMSYHY